MLGKLVSMRDEEVLHTVHGRICLCWCVLIFFLLFFCLRVSCQDVSASFPTCGGRITGTAAQLRPSLGEKNNKTKQREGDKHEKTRGQSK